MARWRRICIDLDDYDCPIGGSIEHYGDSRLDPESITVLARGEWNGRSPEELLENLVALGWSRTVLPFPPYE